MAVPYQYRPSIIPKRISKILFIQGSYDGRKNQSFPRFPNCNQTIQQNLFLLRQLSKQPLQITLIVLFSCSLPFNFVPNKSFQGGGCSKRKERPILQFWPKTKCCGRKEQRSRIVKKDGGAICNMAGIICPPWSEQG